MHLSSIYYLLKNMELTLGIDSLLGNMPTVVSVTLSVVALFFATWLKFKKVDIEEKTSVTSTQAKQVESLMAQIDQLSTQLHQTRQQLAELHEQNIHLMEELRTANKRITELETLLDKKPT